MTLWFAQGCGSQLCAILVFQDPILISKPQMRTSNKQFVCDSVGCSGVAAAAAALQARGVVAHDEMHKPGASRCIAKTTRSVLTHFVLVKKRSLQR